ncbi:hypothetical protein NHQ30_000948 [Ciborinia camelliae]|nr:hypothetical protein NHQ30_000948 [Ciborinia camelliae]
MNVCYQRDYFYDERVPMKFSVQQDPWQNFMMASNTSAKTDTIFHLLLKCYNADDQPLNFYYMGPFHTSEAVFQHLQSYLGDGLTDDDLTNLVVFELMTTKTTANDKLQVTLEKEKNGVVAENLENSPDSARFVLILRKYSSREFTFEVSICGTHEDLQSANQGILSLLSEKLLSGIKPGIQAKLLIRDDSTLAFVCQDFSNGIVWHASVFTGFGGHTVPLGDINEDTINAFLSG